MSMHPLVRRGLAWAPATKAAVLLLLPLPLLLAAVIALANHEIGRFWLAGGALASLWGSGALVLRGLVSEARYLLGERPDPPAVPLKLLAAGLTTVGVTLGAFAGGHGMAGAIVLAGLGGIGHMAFFGRDMRPPRIRVAVVEGVDGAAVTLQLKKAYGRLRGIESAARTIAVPEFQERLGRITNLGHQVLREIERDPADAPRARRFLNLYLDSAERVTVEYARTHGQLRSRPLEDNFRELLVEMENTFAEQHQKLLDHDVMSLDVDIDVLNTRLKREGLG